MSKEMNAQMITMVGIFTALAFLVFGSINSLDGVFENLKMPLFKTLSVGLIWGICISNMIFVFLYCVGKMTKLKFKANENDDATIFQRYPVVWWTNLILVALWLLSTWMHLIQTTNMSMPIFGLIAGKPLIIGMVGSLIVLLLIVFGICFLSIKTRYKSNSTRKHTKTAHRKPTKKSAR